jgi:hypothetical protein
MSHATHLATDFVHDGLSEPIKVLNPWQNLPLSLVILSWANESFKQEFLERPTRMLRNMLAECPRDRTFCVLENTTYERHLVLPTRNPATYSWTREQIEMQLHTEMIEPPSLDYGLPIRVIVHAFCNPIFRRQLMVSPKEVLSAMGYEVEEYDYFLHENTEHTIHLAIPYNKWEDEAVSDEDLQSLLLQDLMPAVVH